MKKTITILTVWTLLTVGYTIWSQMSYYRAETFLFHLTGGLFVAGMGIFAIGMFSQMSAAGLFDGIMYGFKRNRRAKLKEIDPSYEEDEEITEEEIKMRKQSSWQWILVGVSSIVLSYLLILV